MSYEAIIEESLKAVADELNAMCEEAVELKHVYSRTAAVTDLTFIKIIEHRYESLTDELARVAELVKELQVKLPSLMEVEANHGGQSQNS